MKCVDVISKLESCKLQHVNARTTYAAYAQLCYRRSVLQNWQAGMQTASLEDT